MKLSRPRRWSELSRVERVDVYTRGSLHLLLWFFGVAVLTGALPGTDPLRATATVVGGVVVTAAGAATLSAVTDLYPATRPLPWRLVGVLATACLAYVAACGLTAGDDLGDVVALIVVVNLAGSLGGVPDHRVLAVVATTSGLVTVTSRGDVLGFLVGVVVALFVAFTVRASLWMLDVVSELDTARHAQAQLAVAEERLRFSRDVHDVLGRRLSTIAVQSELASTLAQRGDDRAAARMLEVRTIAHEALGEARELARGYRPTNLTSELDGARSLLRSAGIGVHLDVGVVPRGWHEAAGWVVREAVTNVLRHSRATLVQVTYADEVLRVESDGAPSPCDTPAPAAGGTGLRGLRERLEPLGAGLDVAHEGQTWAVLARFPGNGPLSARTRTHDTTPPRPGEENR